MADFTTIINNFLTDSQEQDVTITSPSRGMLIDNQHHYMRIVDRTNKAARYQKIYGFMRDIEHLDNPAYPARAWKNNQSFYEAGNTYCIVAQGIFEQIPVDGHPGSESCFNLATDGTEATGYIVARSLGQNAVVVISRRWITFNAANTQPVTVSGPWIHTTLGHIQPTKFTMDEAKLVYPTGMEGGDWVEYRISFKQYDAENPAYLGAVELYQPPMADVTNYV